MSQVRRIIQISHRDHRRNRGTGTIRDDDEPVTKPSISSVGDASADRRQYAEFHCEIVREYVSDRDILLFNFLWWGCDSRTGRL